LTCSSFAREERGEREREREHEVEPCEPGEHSQMVMRERKAQIQMLYGSEKK
jgi:hypothetical protein